VFLGQVGQDVFGQHCMVTGGAQVSEPTFDFLLGLPPHLVVMVANRNTKVGHGGTGFIAEVVILVVGVAGMVGVLEKPLIAAHGKGTVV